MTFIPDDDEAPPGGLIRDQDKPQDLDDLERERDRADRDEDERDDLPENDEED
jgi:hypothetical protein